jgi:hypothetical protein
VLPCDRDETSLFLVPITEDVPSPDNVDVVVMFVVLDLDDTDEVVQQVIALSRGAHFGIEWS